MTISPVAPVVSGTAAAAQAALRMHAQALGLAPQASRTEVSDMVISACTRPATDPALLDNALCPGAWPIEVSFAETDPDCLRIDVQPGDPGLSGAERVQLALRLAGVPEAAIKPWGDVLDPATFGAFVGASAGRTVHRKAYLELGDPSGALHRSRPELAALSDSVPGLRPHLLAIDHDGRTRWYLEATHGLALLDLFRWGEAVKLAEAVPALIDAVRRLVGTMVLPPTGALLAVRSLTGGGSELKVELTASILRPDAAEVVEQLLVDRPPGFAAYRRWRSAVHAGPTVVSARIATGSQGVRYNAYTSLLGGLR
jgi:hypothetical protein